MSYQDIGRVHYRERSNQGKSYTRRNLPQILENDKERERLREREREKERDREREKERERERDRQIYQSFSHRSQAFQKSTSTGIELKNEKLSRIYGNCLFINLTVIKSLVL